MEIVGFCDVTENDGLVRGHWHGPVTWPERGGLDRWAESLGAYPGGGLERAARVYERELLAAGWRQFGETWHPPPRQRRSTEQAGATVRRLVQSANRSNPPPHTAGPMVALVVGYLEACADLLFYATTDEAWAEGDSELRAMGGGARQQVDPLEPLFGGAGEVLGRASQSGDARALGRGAQSYAVAESKGRTRARWDEIHCSASHSFTASVKGIRAVELAIDAQRSVLGAGIEEIDLAGLTDWLRDKAKPAERVRRYRRRLALRRGAGVHGIVSDASALEATTELSDKAILHRLTQAREQLERRLTKLPEHAEELAVMTGDASFLAPVAAPRRVKPEKSPKRRPSRARQRPSLEASWS